MEKYLRTILMLEIIFIDTFSEISSCQTIPPTPVLVANTFHVLYITRMQNKAQEI